eukprot:comp20730_c0_seq1/m.27102 comp20730_c0_seq1/g.27102  ORF comp20730_c0_seq1/g.27102 comp20730_c0_seq1/m.27102 type:complete len:410 (-) comp20730_c0_seq1:761-1990(-)
MAHNGNMNLPSPGADDEFDETGPTDCGQGKRLSLRESYDELRAVLPILDTFDKPTTITLLRKANEYVHFIKQKGGDLEAAKANLVKENGSLQNRIAQLQQQLHSLQEQASKGGAVTRTASLPVQGIQDGLAEPFRFDDGPGLMNPLGPKPGMMRPGPPFGKMMGPPGMPPLHHNPLFRPNPRNTAGRSQSVPTPIVLDGNPIIGPSTPLKFEHNAFIAGGQAARRSTQRFTQTATMPLTIASPSQTRSMSRLQQRRHSLVGDSLAPQAISEETDTKPFPSTPPALNNNQNLNQNINRPLPPLGMNPSGRNLFAGSMPVLPERGGYGGANGGLDGSMSLDGSCHDGDLGLSLGGDLPPLMRRDKGDGMDLDFLDIPGLGNPMSMDMNHQTECVDLDRIRAELRCMGDLDG